MSAIIRKTKGKWFGSWNFSLLIYFY